MAFVASVVHAFRGRHRAAFSQPYQLGKGQGRQTATTAPQHPGAQPALDEEPGRRLLAAGWSVRQLHPEPPVGYLAHVLEVVTQARVVLDPRLGKVVANGQVLLVGLWMVV